MDKGRKGKLNRLIISPKGMSLIEIVIAVAILGIITTAFLDIFTVSFKNVFISGDKSKAMTEASTKLERLYAEKDISTLNEAAINGLIQAQKADTREKLDETSTTTTWYYIEPVYSISDISGYMVTISMAYHNQKGETGRIKLTSYIKGGA